MNWFGGGSKNTKKPKAGSKVNKEQKKLDENRLSEIVFSQHSMRGQGTKKLDCQDSVTVVEPQEKFPEKFYFFAVLDGHGSSGREASTAASDNF